MEYPMANGRNRPSSNPNDVTRTPAAVQVDPVPHHLLSGSSAPRAGGGGTAGGGGASSSTPVSSLSSTAHLHHGGSTTGPSSSSYHHHRAAAAAAAAAAMTPATRTLNEEMVERRRLEQTNFELKVQLATLEKRLTGMQDRRRGGGGGGSSGEEEEEVDTLIEDGDGGGDVGRRGASVRREDLSPISMDEGVDGGDDDGSDHHRRYQPHHTPLIPALAFSSQEVDGGHDDDEDDDDVDVSTMGRSQLLAVVSKQREELHTKSLEVEERDALLAQVHTVIEQLHEQNVDKDRQIQELEDQRDELQGGKEDLEGMEKIHIATTTSLKLELAKCRGELERKRMEGDDIRSEKEDWDIRMLDLQCSHDRLESNKNRLEDEVRQLRLWQQDQHQEWKERVIFHNDHRENGGKGLENGPFARELSAPAFAPVGEASDREVQELRRALAEKDAALQQAREVMERSRVEQQNPDPLHRELPPQAPNGDVDGVVALESCQQSAASTHDDYERLLEEAAETIHILQQELERLQKQQQEQREGDPHVSRRRRRPTGDCSTPSPSVETEERSYNDRGNLEEEEVRQKAMERLHSKISELTEAQELLRQHHREEMSNLEERLSRSQSVIQQREGSIGEQKELLESLEEERRKHLDTIGQLESELQAMREQVASLERQLSQVMTDLGQSQDQGNAYVKQISLLEQDQRDTLQRLESIQMGHEKEKQERRRRQDEQDMMQEEALIVIDNLEGEVKELKSDRDVRQRRFEEMVDEKEEELQSLSRQLELVKHQLERRCVELRSAKLSSEEGRKEMLSVQQQLHDVTVGKSKAEEEREASRQDAARQRRLRAMLTQEVETWKKERDALAEEHAAKNLTQEEDMKHLRQRADRMIEENAKVQRSLDMARTEIRALQQQEKDRDSSHVTNGKSHVSQSESIRRDLDGKIASLDEMLSGITQTVKVSKRLMGDYYRHQEKHRQEGEVKVGTFPKTNDNDECHQLLKATARLSLQGQHLGQDLRTVYHRFKKLETECHRSNT